MIIGAVLITRRTDINERAMSDFLVLIWATHLICAYLLKSNMYTGVIYIKPDEDEFVLRLPLFIASIVAYVYFLNRLLS